MGLREYFKNLRQSGKSKSDLEAENKTEDESVELSYDERVEKIKSVPVESGWEYDRIVDSGFVMFEKFRKNSHRHRSNEYSEAGIGPIDNGWRYYRSKEVKSGDYRKQIEVEGTFEKAFEAFVEDIGN